MSVSEPTDAKHTVSSAMTVAVALPAAEKRTITFDRYNDPVGAIVIDKTGAIYGNVQYADLEEKIRELVYK